jgi:hypothetical protein
LLRHVVVCVTERAIQLLGCPFWQLSAGGWWFYSPFSCTVAP